MPSLTLDLKPGGALEKRILEAVRDRINFSKRTYKNRHAKWIKAEEAALAYIPEKGADALRRGERDRGKPQYTTMVVPYSYGILMASHTYWTTVFMGRSPMLQFGGRHGEGEQNVQAIEAYMDYQVQVGGMLVPFYIWLYDVGKYGIGIISNYWDEEVNTVSEITEVDEMLMGVLKTGRKVKKKITQKVKGYEGNRITNVRPYDFFPDPRVTLANFQKGEFCASAISLGWSEVLARRDAGYYTKEAVAKLGGKRDDGGWGSTEFLSNTETQGSSQLLMPEVGGNYGEANARKAADVVKGYECYINLVPKQWGLGKGEQSEKWVFTVNQDYSVALGAQPLGALHNKYGFQVIELEPEGYSLTHRGLPEIVQPIQDTMDWLLNSHMYNVRKTLNNQFVVDPSRIVMKDVLQPQPGGIIRAKPQAYGQDIRTAISQLNVVDITRSHLTDLQIMNDIGQRASGVNDQILGMIGSGGGRKTATEVRTSSSFGVNRLKTSAEYFSAMGFAPLSQMMVQNSQQYYEADRKFKIVGDLAQGTSASFMQVTPEMISGFYDMVPIDGTLPVDRFAQASLWQQLFAQLRNIPEVGQQYDIAKMFGWVAQLAGLKNINQFKIRPQMMGDGQVQQEVQRGNLVPLPTAVGAAGMQVPEQGPAGPSA